MFNRYTKGAIENSKLAKIYYPGWILRVYYSNISNEVKDALIRQGAEIIQVKEMNMFSRFMVAGDPAVDRFIVRDSDSRLNSRERFAVQEWIESNKSLHSIRDHVKHCYSFNGGMWGGLKGLNTLNIIYYF